MGKCNAAAQPAHPADAASLRYAARLTQAVGPLQIFYNIKLQVDKMPNRIHILAV